MPVKLSIMAKIGVIFLTWRRHLQKDLVPHKITLKQQYILKQLTRKSFLYPSEIAEMLALEHLFDRVTPGGLIVFDDFGWTCNSNQMKAELAFMEGRNHCVLELPTGQGVVIKHA